jgi:hypothetical protein
MRASIRLSVGVAGETASISQQRTGDGVVGTSPTATPASAGVLTARGSASAGTITIDDTNVTTGEKAVLTWVDVDGNLKHRYNVACTVTETSTSGSGSDSDSESSGGGGYEVAITGGAGDDLPAQDSAINVGLQASANITFDFDDVDTFLITSNARGVVVCLDSTEVEKLVTDMGEDGIAFWLRSSGFAAPITGTPVTHVVFGSGDTEKEFTPMVLALYDATP